MGNAKHTQGPWAVDPNGNIYHVNGGFVPIRTPFRDDAFKDGPARSDHSEETLEANARLIAAAPELLEALEAVLFHAEDQTLYTAGQTAIKDAHTAIAKAKGE